MKRSALWLILLAGCTPPQPSTVDAIKATTVIGGFPHRGPQPLNCGTPYSFKICPVPVTAVRVVATLPAPYVPTVDIVAIPGQLPQLAADPE